jgi:hypothetical protein
MRLFSVLLLFSSVSCVLAEEPSNCTVRVPITVVSTSGYPVARELQAGDLRYRIGNREIPGILEKAAVERLILVLDNTSSMQGASVGAKKMIRDLVSQAPQHLPISLLVFDDGTHVASEREKISEVLAQLGRPTGSRGLFESVTTAAKKFTLTSGDLVIAVSDAMDSGKPEPSLEIFRSSGARFSALITLVLNSPNLSDLAAGMGHVHQLVKESGGAKLVLEDPSDRAVRAQFIDPWKPVVKNRVLPDNFLPSLLSYYRVSLDFGELRTQQSLKISWVTKHEPTLTISGPSRIPTCALPATPEHN